MGLWNFFCFSQKMNFQSISGGLRLLAPFVFNAAQLMTSPFVVFPLTQHLFVILNFSAKNKSKRSFLRHKFSSNMDQSTISKMPLVSTWYFRTPGLFYKGLKIEESRLF